MFLRAFSYLFVVLFVVSCSHQTQLKTSELNSGRSIASIAQSGYGVCSIGVDGSQNFEPADLDKVTVGDGFAAYTALDTTNLKKVYSYCSDDKFAMTMKAYCRANPDSAPQTWQVQTFDDAGNLLQSTCASSGCKPHACPERHQHSNCNHGGQDKRHMVEPNYVQLHHLKSNRPFSVPTRIKPGKNTKRPMALAATPGQFKVDFKILILSATDDAEVEPSYGQAKNALMSLGIPFDVKVLTENGNRVSTGSLNLVNPDGSGKYYGIITTTGELAYQVSTDVWDSALTPDQWNELKTYEADYYVRRVSLYTFPTTDIGMATIGTANGNADALTLLTPTTSYASGILPTAKPPLIGTWKYPAKVTNATMATPFMQFKNARVASSIAKFSDGRQQLHFFFDQSIYMSGSMIISPIWINWLTRNTHVGKRRIYLNIHVDDVFLDTDLWNPATLSSTEDGSRIYRIKAADLDTYLTYQNGTLRNITANPNFKTEFAYNGSGVIENGGYANDALFKRAKILANQFYWVTHTWDHADLTNATYEQTTWELTQNYPTAQQLGVWGGSDFSMNSMVNPAITGLFNGQVLEATYAQGIKYIVGDNSRPELRNSNPYLGLYTNTQDNGFDGVLILPRHATNVFYNTSTKTEMISLYNFLYSSYFGQDSTWAQIMAREEELAVAALLSYRPDPWMFHQANLRKSGSDSLLSLWLKKVTSGVRKYSNFPILNLKMNDLKDVFLRREKYEDCGFQGQLEVENYSITKINATSSNECSVDITGVSASGNGITEEIYGDTKNINFAISSMEPKQIILNNPVPVN